MLFCVRFHEVSNIIAADVGVFEDGAYFTEFLFQMLRHTNICFHAPKQTLISHLAQYSLRAHDLDGIQGSSYFGGNKSLLFTIRFLHFSPLTFIHFHHVVPFAADILSVGSRFFSDLSHGFVSFLVKLFSAVESAVMAVPITPLKLVHSL